MTEKYLVIGEGLDEKNFFEALLKHMKATGIQVEQYGGKNNLKNYLRALKTFPDYHKLISIAITRDADDDSAFRSVCSALNSEGLPVPVVPALQATGEGHPHVTVFIMPDNVNIGMLEDLCLQALPSDELNCIDSMFGCLPASTGNAGFSPSAKARVFAWLATRTVAGLRLGEAALRGYIDWEHPAFQNLRQFLQQL